MPDPRPLPGGALTAVRPLRKIVRVLRPALDAWDNQTVELACGHVVRISGGAIYRGRCRKCAEEAKSKSRGDAMD